MKFSKKILICSLMLISTSLQANRTPAKPDHSFQVPTKTSQTHFVQFFSSANATKAEGMKNTLKLQGYPAFVFVNARKQTSQTYYQVQVGPFTTRDLANKAKVQVIEKYPQFDFLSHAILKTSL